MHVNTYTRIFKPQHRPQKNPNRWSCEAPQAAADVHAGTGAVYIHTLLTFKDSVDIILVFLGCNISFYGQVESVWQISRCWLL